MLRMSFISHKKTQLIYFGPRHASKKMVRGLLQAFVISSLATKPMTTYMTKIPIVSHCLETKWWSNGLEVGMHGTRLEGSGFRLQIHLPLFSLCQAGSSKKVFTKLLNWPKNHFLHAKTYEFNNFSRTALPTFYVLRSVPSSNLEVHVPSQ